MCYVLYLTSWTLYCKCTNFQANHNLDAQIRNIDAVGLYIANVLTFKRITTRVKAVEPRMCWTLYCKCTNFQANHNVLKEFIRYKKLDSILQMY